MALFNETGRSKFESTAYTVLLLAFFFAVGLAGGVLYRLLPTTTSSEVTGQTARVPVSTASTAAPTPAPTPAAAPAPAPAAKASAARDAAVPPPTPAPVKTAAAKTEPAPAPAALSAALPADVAPNADGAPGMSAAVASIPTSDTAYSPAPKASPSDTGTARAISAAKSLTPPPKATPEKRVAAASKAPAPQSASESAIGPVRVQFGAFTLEDNAHETQWAVEATGLPVEVTQETTRKGHVLYYVRSHPFADRAAALSAAIATQQKAKSFVNPVDVDYMIVSDAAAQQQAQAAAH